MLLVRSHELLCSYEGTREILVVRNPARIFLCESLWFDCLPLTAVDVAVKVDFHVFQLVEAEGGSLMLFHHGDTFVASIADRSLKKKDYYVLKLVFYLLRSLDGSTYMSDYFQSYSE